MRAVGLLAWVGLQSARKYVEIGAHVFYFTPDEKRQAPRRYGR